MEASDTDFLSSCYFCLSFQQMTKNANGVTNRVISGPANFPAVIIWLLSACQEMWGVLVTVRLKLIKAKLYHRQETKNVTDFK